MPQLQQPKVKKYRKTKAVKKAADEPIPLFDEGEAADQLSPDEQPASDEDFNSPQPGNDDRIALPKDDEEDDPLQPDPRADEYSPDLDQ